MGLKGVAQKGKGKAVAETQSSGGKRKLDSDGKGKSSGGRRRTDRGVLKFFDEVADDADGNDESDFGEDDFMDDGAEPGPKVTVEPGKSFDIPVMPKEEVMDEDEFDKMMEERYKSGSTYVTYAEDYEEKSFSDRGFVMPTEKDPVIWKVKCAVGREKYLAFCLMQKFVDLKSIGTKLHIISAFTVEHVKGFIFMEADKQSDLNLACNGVGGVFSSRVMAVPRDEVSRLFSIRSEYNEITVGMWARVKNGIYKGDLGQVVAVNKSRKRATVKLIPRIDLLALTEKFGEGRTSTKRTSTPAPRLISASELEEFRPLIQSRQDRDTGKVFEVLDGMMIKDGFIFKKISIDSLSFWGVVPSEEELLKFKTTENHESDDREWLSQLYGEEKKTNVTGNVVMPEKGESSSGSTAKNGFEVHNLVCFGRKDFGVIIGMEKDETYKILKEGAEGPVVVNVQRREIKSGPSNMKFTASDHRMKAICVSDTVKVTEGPHEGKQGVVKLIYRGTIFLYDGNEEVNGGYFCCKSRICEKIKPSLGSSKEKGESDPVTFEEFPPSPKSPLSPEKSFQARESREFKQGDEGNIYSIGQLLRIRVGPLKGYLCRVLAIYRSDVTVKLDSKHKVITVKSEHLSEVQKKNPIMSSDEPESSSFKPSDLLGSDGGSRGWMDGAGTSAPNDGWNTGGLSGERSSWGNSSANPSSPKGEANTDAEDGWGSKVTPKKNNVSWGAQVAENDQAGGLVNSTDSAGKSTGGSWGLKTGGSDSWDKAIDVSGDPKGSSGNDENQDGVKQSEDSWGKGKNTTSNAGGSWGDATAEKNKDDAWGKGKSVVEGGGWEKKSDFGTSDAGSKPPQKSWDMGNQKPSSDTSSWGNASQSQDAAGWGQKSAGNSGPGGFGGNHDSAWSKQANKSESTGGNQDSAWGKKSSDENQASAWGKKSSDENQASAWGQKSNNENQASAWGQKGSGGNQESAWGKKSNDENQDSAWGQKSNSGNQDSAWGQKSNSGNQDSAWGKKSGGTNRNEDSAWGKKSNVNFSSGGNRGNQDSGWGNKSNQSSEPGGTNGNEDSAWGKKSNLNSEAGGNQSSWGGKSNWNSEAGGNGGNQSSWGGKSNWNSEAGGSGVNQGSGWGNKSSGSGNAEQNSNWGGKSDWSSGSGFKGNQSFDSGNDDQTDGGGNWRGGRGSFRGRGGDRGGFGGRGGDRGGFGGRGGDRGGFGGQGDRGGFGGRGGDRGGFGGRGGDRGGFGGRGRSDRGDFGGRGGSDRGGGFGGRGRGRRDDSGGGGGWNNRDSGGNGSWRNKGDNNSGEENRNSDGGGGGWSQGGGGFKKEWQGGGCSGNAETRNSGGGGWRQQSDGGNGGGWSSGQSSGGWKGSNTGEQGGGSWGKGTSSSGGAAGGGWGNNNNNSKSPGGGGWGSTNNNSESSGGSGGGWGTNNSNNSKSAGGGGAGWGTNNNSKSPGGGGGSGGGGWGSSNNNSETPGSGGGGGWGSTNNNSKSPGAGGGWGSTNNNSEMAGAGGGGGWGSTKNEAKSTQASGGSGGAGGSGGGSWGTAKPGGGGWNTDAGDSKGKNNGGW